MNLLAVHSIDGSAQIVDVAERALRSPPTWPSFQAFQWLVAAPAALRPKTLVGLDGAWSVSSKSGNGFAVRKRD
ncbi:hypothetical protein, partial [Devosia sp.]|uniref:hypothetical protein n=1 Tax=Devosia sp. TaxID=1871048 RepID=UPI002AFE9824